VAGDGARIRTLILNGAECEPYITADQSLMRERPEAIIAGAQIIRSLLGSKECLIGIEDNKPDAIEALRKAADGTGIEIVVVPTRYPSGGEKQLIQLLTGREVPTTASPPTSACSARTSPPPNPYIGRCASANQSSRASPP